ncbi:DUF4340 domain-containing protein [uncultured Oscillibacter sp.]|uniref:DUF4340 domain-containing protein n=1 Tax=uncultured Oscillibacter sp. TaxID=876091 RepID=UPI002803B9F8|nr:DUF4340 domain-containing protein [uncultured Oscillibacter sp.]
MKRAKKLYILLGVLVAVCAITFGVSRYQTRQEEIKNSGEVILEVPTDSVESLSWDVGDRSFSFHKETTEGDTDSESIWIYDEDDVFPVDKTKINNLLSCFESLTAAFVIENPEDLGQYGLTDPSCTINFSDGETSYTVLLGDYSPMDSQRYVSIGDGNVYLVSEDPMEEFDVELSKMLDDDDIPYLEEEGTTTSIRFSGEINYEIAYEADSDNTYRADDVYFTEQNGRQVPLDSTRVSDYLHEVSFVFPDEYVTYKATDEDLAACGLDNPQLVIEADYNTEDQDGNTVSNSFTMSISRDPDELAKAQSSDAETTSEDEADTETEEITAYMRIGDSKIIYRLSGEDYETLMAAGYNDLRHTEVLPADFADIAQIDISLEGTDYTITSEGDAEERTYFYEDEELDIADLQSAMQTLTADSFTDEQPAEKEEIHLTLHLDLEGEPSAEIGLYRYDGSYCLAVVDGTPMCLVQRSYVVDLIEAVNAIVLS